MIDTEGKLERDAREIFRRAVEAVTPDRLVDKAFRDIDVRTEVESAGRCVLLAVGKAACGMSRRLLDHVWLTEGLVTVPAGVSCRVSGAIQVNASAHPVPDAASAFAAGTALDLATKLKGRDVAVVLISGGGSSLWAGVPADIRLEDKQSTVRQLLLSGAPIEELNAVRKHLSTIKGGRLAQAIYPARCVTLVVSDVVGDDLSVIASGPTVPDQTTYGEAVDVLDGRGGYDRYPAAVVERLQRGARGEFPETPTQGDPVFARNTARIIGSNSDALDAAALAARHIGYDVRRDRNPVTGEASRAGRSLAAAMLDTDVSVPTCFLWGGETTVVVKGGGKGGRNQELVLSAAIALDGTGQPTVLLSAGTDGVDGPTDAAGAVVSPATAGRARRLGLQPEDHLHDNDSYSFFKAVGGHVVTGPTGTNVMDVQVGLRLPQQL